MAEADVGTRDPVHEGQERATDGPVAVEELARLWLAAERDASRQGNAAGSEERARQASAAYEAAVTSASPEDLLIAWQAALKTQQDQEMGSESWSQAREVSELIRVEYLASK